MQRKIFGYLLRHLRFCRRFAVPDKKEEHLEGDTLLFGPDDRIRTCGILLPKQALYQTEPRPDIYSFFLYLTAGASALPVAVPGGRLADGAAALHAVRLGCPIFSLPINRLRQLSTPAHAYALLYLPPAAQSNAAAATRSPRCICHRQRSGRSPN